MSIAPTRVINPHLSVRPVTIEVARDPVTKATTTVTYDLYYVTGPQGLPDVVAFMDREKRYAVDTETSGLSARKDKLATLQIGSPLGATPAAYVIDLRLVTAEDLQPLLQRLNDPRHIKFGQNLKFECKFLQAAYGLRMRTLVDTQQMEQVIRAGLFQAKAWQDHGPASEKAAYKYSSMGHLARFYLGIEIDKDTALRTGFFDTAPGRHTDRQLIYAAGDVIYPFYIAAHQREVVAERKLGTILKIEFALIPVLADAELTGTRIDTRAWRALWQEAVQKLADAETALDHLIRPYTQQQDLFDTADSKERPVYPKTNKPLNYDSPLQLKWVIQAYCAGIGWKHEIITDPKRWWNLRRLYGAEWLRKRLERNATLREQGLLDQIRPVTEDDIPDHVVPWHVGCPLLETDKNTLTLRMVRGQLPRELVLALLEYGKYSIRCSTFGNEFINKHVDPGTGRLYTEFHQCITNTGRLSASPNTMNIPRDKRYRACFVAGPGKKLFLADYSQIEPRLSAECSDDFVYLSAFINAEDLYVKVAEAMFEQTVDKHTEEGARLRQFAKALVLGLAYRMGPWKLLDQITLAMAEDIIAGRVPMPTFEMVQQMYDRFFQECGGIREYQDRCSTAADPKAKGVLKLYDALLDDFVTYIVAPCGRTRFFGPEAKGIFTEAPNAPIQGCSATITKGACVLFQDKLYARGWEERCHIINIVHDEIVGEADEEIAAECAQLLKEAMEEAGRMYVLKVPVIAEFPTATGVVDHWMKG